jgi:DNA primase
MFRTNLHQNKQSLLGENRNFVFNNSNIKTFKDLLQDVDIVEVLETEYDLFFTTQSGGWFNTNCPLPGHDDSSPSFGVNQEKGTFHCFGCGASGDLISFVRKMEGLGFKQALERVMIITGINPDVELGKTYRALKDIKNLADDYLNYQVEYDLPGGITPIQFLRSVNERLKKFELIIGENSEEIEWIESIYQKVDTFIMKEDYKSLNGLWKNLGNEMKKRKELRECKND